MGTEISKGLRLLIVEDHDDTAELLAGLLEMRGHKVRTARLVSAALELVVTETFDLVLSDVGLPDATGYELMRRLRETTTIRGIAMSGWGRAEDIARSHEAGFMEHLTKPVQLARLEQAIERARVVEFS